MTKQFELLAPGGDLDAIKAAILAGADAIYCGLDQFNARSRATNMSFEHLVGVISLAHQHDCQVFLTLNIILLDSEFPSLFKLLNKLSQTQIDGVIVQDLGLFDLLAKRFPTLDVHASTQINTHNQGQLQFMSRLGVSRVNLSRELNVNEMASVTRVARELGILTEVFVHGSYCIGFSGLCYMSSVQSGHSGNRGRCSQPCRDQYIPTAQGKSYPLNLKDNSAYSELSLLAKAGVYSLKIEGRIKKAPYVHSVVNSWRRHIDTFLATGKGLDEKESLYKVFNRDFSNGYLMGDISKEMFIDNPRDHSIQHLLATTSAEQSQHICDEKSKAAELVALEINTIVMAAKTLSMQVQGQLGEPLHISLTCAEQCWTFQSQSLLKFSEQSALNTRAFEKRFKSLNGPGYDVMTMDLAGLDEGLFIPFRELTELKEKMNLAIRGPNANVAPVHLPSLPRSLPLSQQPQLAVLIDSVETLATCAKVQAEIHYQLPEAMKRKGLPLIPLFKAHSHLIPWFPAILLGDDYQAAIDWLKTIRPQKIVTNNSGVGHAAAELGIHWVAGPQLNVANSYSLSCLQTKFSSSGAFVSSEINRQQIGQLLRPEHFELYYSLYHPIELMTSRQCFFHQTVGCKKSSFDDKCLTNCEKSAAIINLKETSFVINKKKGEHNVLYAETRFLNTQIVDDLAGLFSHFLIDIRNLPTQTASALSPTELLKTFEQLLTQAGTSDNSAKKQLDSKIQPTVCEQYRRGL